MFFPKIILPFYVLAILSCRPSEHQSSNTIPVYTNNHDTSNYTSSVSVPDSVIHLVPVGRDIKVKQYFSFIDSVVNATNQHLTGYQISEYILVHANAWIIDSLASFDYYRLMEQDRFVYDQTQLVILHADDTLRIPDSTWAANIENLLKNTRIDVNIPQYTLWIYRFDKIWLTCKVRVGRNARQYLQLAGREMDLRTPIGKGEIVRVAREPYYINPRTGKKYKGTNRDDKRFTLMPIIPWLEPSIGSIRYGAMIHPTTNPETLGKAYSNGCVGTTESDAWYIYYNAPIGTSVTFRYDLKVASEKGDTIQLEDIYGLSKKK
ncbi:MAG: L,D-transpeptidase [Flavobacteriales bacterium]|nr:L,D-transpeptidase [Flavobacteriales bacterium]